MHREVDAHDVSGVVVDVHVRDVVLVEVADRGREPVGDGSLERRPHRPCVLSSIRAVEAQCSRRIGKGGRIVVRPIGEAAGHIQGYFPRKATAKFEQKFVRLVVVFASARVVDPEVIAAGQMTCPSCEYQFERESSNHSAHADTTEVVSGSETTTHDIVDVRYSVHQKHGRPDSLRVTYTLDDGQRVSHFCCLEHHGITREIAESWWERRSSEPLPATARHACYLATAGALVFVALLMMSGM